MFDIAIMIEGQDGLNWERWQRITRVVEEAGFAGLFRSDHYTNASPPDKDSLELWVSLTWLADHTRRIEFGPLVSPVSFRHPTMTARMAAAVDDLSGGRLVLGVGAGWQKREHDHYGWQLLEPEDRFRRFTEGLEIIYRLLRTDQPVSYEGQYYRLKEAVILPRPQRPGGPPILVGGNGFRQTLSLAARYADEWNAVYLPVDRFTKLNSRLDELILEAARSPGNVRRSMMTGIVFDKDEQEVRRKVDDRTAGKTDAGGLRERGVIVGTSDEIVQQLGSLSDAGLQRIMLQWLDLDDMEGLEALAASVLPHFNRTMK
jgi:F420-dependent oxidoreductase-like protein